MPSTGLKNGGEEVISDLINLILIYGMIIVENALENPVIEVNIPITRLLKYKLRELLGKDDHNELAGLFARDLSKRIEKLLLKIKK